MSRGRKRRCHHTSHNRCYLPGWYEDSWGDRIKENCFRRRSAQASSIKIRASQLRKAPSLSKLGGLREAAALQFRTASSASSSLPRTRAARKWSSRRHRAKRSSNILESDSRYSISSLRFMDNLSLFCWRPSRRNEDRERARGSHCAIDIHDDDEQRLFPDGSDARLIERDRDRYYGQHSGISNGGSANVVDADCGSIWRKNFLPENRISSNLRPPLPSVSSIAASSLSGRSSGITLAGTVALTLLSSLIFSSTSGPAPSHCTVYSPAGSCVFPAIVVD